MSSSIAHSAKVQEFGKRIKPIVRFPLQAKKQMIENNYGH